MPESNDADRIRKLEQDLAAANETLKIMKQEGFRHRKLSQPTVNQDPYLIASPLITVVV